MNIAIILSGGVGLRLGSTMPKQYIEVNNKMIIEYCMNTFVNNSNIDAIQIVASKEWQSKIIEKFNESQILLDKFRGFTEPGETRQWSILNALTDIRTYATDDSYVMIHDAARPLVSDGLIERCFNTAYGCDGVLPVVKSKDTMYMINNDGDKIDSLLNRDKIVSGQAPEVFALGKYYEANLMLDKETFEKINGSTEVAIISGLNVAITDGEEINFKITTNQDLERFMQIINN